MASGERTIIHDGSYGSAATGRIEIIEAWDDATNASSVTVKLQINSSYTGRWQARGIISVNGQNLISNDEIVTSSAPQQWDTVKSVTLNVPHAADGKGKLTLNVSPGGYTHFALLNYNNAGVYGYVANCNNKEIELHDNDIGSYVMINGDKYDIYIGNGSGWDRYDVKIGNGSEWENY